MWVYTKLYFEHHGALDRKSDRFLTESFLPLVAELAAAGKITQAHFLRYVDEGYHLRLRLKARAGAEASVFEMLMKLPSREGAMVPATYEAEIAKYGGEAGMGIAEGWFTASSVLALHVIKSACPTATRAAIAQGVLSDLLARITSDRDAQRELLREYRAIWAGYAAAPARVEPAGAPPAPLEASLAAWTRACRGFETEYRALAAEGRLTAPFASILLNIAHLLNNRLGLGPSYELAFVDRLLPDAGQAE